MISTRLMILMIAVFIIFPPVLSSAGTVDLPATGQTTCYDELGNVIACSGTGQDGDIRAGLHWAGSRFTDNGDGTMTDNLTGLMWLKDVNCAQTIGHDPEGRGAGYLTWQQALDFVAGINSGTHDISNCGSYTANHTDWRLPNINEIEILDNYETFEIRWLEQQGFVNMPAFNDWWSSTSLASPPTSAYTSNGYASVKINVRWGLPVRGTTTGPAKIWKTGQTASYAVSDDGYLQMGIAWPQPRFLDHGDGTVTDNLTGLMWLKDANCANTIGYDPEGTADGTMTWQHALDFVAGVNADKHDISTCALYTANYTDWRLPNVREHRSLMDYSRYNTALPSDHPFIRVQTGHYYWTSTTYSLLPDIALQEDKWYAWISAYPKTDWHWVWPVRAGTAEVVDPIPDIKANGSDGPLTIAQGNQLTIVVSLDPGSHDGEDADWWVAATSPFGVYWFTLNSGWVRFDAPIRVYGGPLFNLSPYTILEVSTLPVGNYTFYFAVDHSMDGVLDATYLDFVSLTIQ